MFISSRKILRVSSLREQILTRATNFLVCSLKFHGCLPLSPSNYPNKPATRARVLFLSQYNLLQPDVVFFWGALSLFIFSVYSIPAQLSHKHARAMKGATTASRLKRRFGDAWGWDTAGFRCAFGFRNFTRGSLTAPFADERSRDQFSHFPKDAIANSRVRPFIFLPLPCPCSFSQRLQTG